MDHPDSTLGAHIRRQKTTFAVKERPCGPCLRIRRIQTHRLDSHALRRQAARVAGRTAASQQHGKRKRLTINSKEMNCTGKMVTVSNDEINPHMQKMKNHRHGQNEGKLGQRMVQRKNYEAASPALT